jgi:hypothetical protein
MGTSRQAVRGGPRFIRASGPWIYPLRREVWKEVAETVSESRVTEDYYSRLTRPIHPAQQMG